MLQKLNERIQGVVAWLVIVLIAITFTLFGVDYYLQSHQTTNAKVVVNGHPLTNQAFEVNYRRLRSQQEEPPTSSAGEKQLQEQALTQMISNEVTVQAARDYGFDVSLNQANAAILNIPQFQEDGHFSAQRYQQALNGAMFTPETFQNEVRQGMLMNQQRFAFVASSFALPAEIKRFVTLYMQTRNYDYVIIPAQQFESQVKISPDEVKAYYKKHQSSFLSPEQVTLDYITLSMSGIKNQIHVSDDDVTRYYEENQNNYLTPAQWQVAHILFAVPSDASQEEAEKISLKADAAYQALQKNPAKFEASVVDLSDDKLSIPDKGILPWITAGQNEYAKILANMNQPGTISTPQRTKLGYEIFKLKAYKPVAIKSLAEVQQTIKEQLVTETAQAKYAQALEQLGDLSYQTPDTLIPVAKALKLKIQTTEPFSRVGGKNPVTQNKLIVNAAFNHDVLDLSNNSEPLQLDADSVVVIRVNKHIPAKEQSLNAVTSKIVSILTRTQAKAKAKALGVALAKPDQQTQHSLTTDNKLVWHSVTDAARDNDKENAAVNNLAFNLLHPESREGITLDNGDYAVVRLKQINPGKLSALDQEQKDSLIQQIEATNGMMDYDLYVNSLISQAKIEKH